MQSIRAIALLVFALAAPCLAQSPAPEYDGLYYEYETWVYEAGWENYTISEGTWRPPTFDRWIEENYGIWIEPTYENWQWTVDGWVLVGYQPPDSEPVVLVENPLVYPALDDVSYTVAVPGQKFSGTLSATDATFANRYVDYYAFRGDAGDVVDIQLYSSEFDAYLRLTDSKGNWIGEDDDSLGNLNSRLLVTLPAADGYLIHATSYSDFAMGSYTLTLGVFAGLPSDFPRTPIAVGETLSGALTDEDPIAVFRSGFEDAYELRLDAPQDLSITLASPDASMDPYLYVLDETGSRILHENDDFFGVDSLVSASFPAGVYVLVVSTYDGVAGNYSISVQPGLTEAPAEPIEIFEVRTATEVFLAALSGEDLLRLTVDPDADWSNHGRYLAAVTRAARDLVRSGHLTQREAGRLVAEAARSETGKRQKLESRFRLAALARRPGTLTFRGPEGSVTALDPREASLRAR